MICVSCGQSKTEVFNSRQSKNGMNVWRRRRCLACGHEFTTNEKPNLSLAWDIKSPSKVKPYSPTRLLLDIYKACDHLPNADDAAAYIAAIVENEILKQNTSDKHITTATIVTTCLQVLRRYDSTAHLKYLSYNSARYANKEVPTKPRKKAIA